MEGTLYKTKEDVLKRAQEAIGIPMGKIDKTGRITTGKGAIGSVLEESWFGYKINSESEPDFPEAGVELKATPYIKNKNGIRAKERLVVNIINYMTEFDKTFRESDFWHKCECLLIMSYEHRKEVSKAEYTIDKAILFTFPEEDLLIIEQDWKKIIDKIRAGQAHLITEGDTLYMAACTKGATAASVRQQPFSDIPAKQRAYSLKSSYMTHILNDYIFGSKQDEHVIKDWRDLHQPDIRCLKLGAKKTNQDEHVIKDLNALQQKGFEQYIIDELQAYYGMTQEMLKQKFGIVSNAKSLNDILLRRMLGITGSLAKTTEFKNANIIPKTIRIQKNGHIKESMSFPTFKFKEIIKETWENSELRNYLEPTKFMFVIFNENLNGEYVFSKVMFWNIPAEDLEEVHKVWDKTVEVIQNGVELHFDGRVTRNNFPKSTENRVSHVRPHAQNSGDTYPLPDGREMPKQCFWFNRSYVESIVIDKPQKSKVLYDFDSLNRELKVAEETDADKYGK